MLSIDDLTEETDATVTFSLMNYLNVNQTILLVPGEDQSLNVTMQPVQIET